MNALLCIGCDQYTSPSLAPLNGAEADAKAIFEVLCSSGYYDQKSSILLLSPPLVEVEGAFSFLFPLPPGVNGFTFFFAGHGDIKSSSFYVCLKDTDVGKLSITAFPITKLFSIIGELPPAEVNVIVDACAAGGSSYDVGSLTKPALTGASTSSSISFLGACASDQFAGEINGHGVMTKELLGCLKGEQKVQDRSPSLDLVQIGTFISPRLQSQHSDQRPISWGLSLFGNSNFAPNPFYTQTGHSQYFPVPNISAFSSFGAKIRSLSPQLWDMHQNVPKDFSPSEFVKLLKQFEAGASPEELISLNQGLSASLFVKAQESADLMMPSICSMACMVSLLPIVDSPSTQGYLRAKLEEWIDLDQKCLDLIVTHIKEDSCYLLNSQAGLADPYFLPLKISRLLGWIGCRVIIKKILSGRFDQVAEYTAAKQILETYPDGLATVSDAQASFLHLFLTACHQEQWTDLSEQVVQNYYVSFCERAGNMTPWKVTGVECFDYLLSLSESELKPKKWKRANPSLIAPVLLYWGEITGHAKNWSLRALDRHSFNIFIPENYRQFGDGIIENGDNHHRQIGFGIWRVEEFNHFYSEVINQASTRGAFNLPSEGIALCALSSLLFPDRVAHILTN